MLKLDYGYGTTANNGNVLSQTITVPDVGVNAGFVAVQSYTYDELNRLKSATENSTPNGGSSSQSWKQTYLFDRFGNRTFDTSSGATTTLPSGFNAHIYNPMVDPSNNQFAGGQDYTYDAAGNVTQDASGKKFVYDGENKQTSFGTGGSSTNGGTYFYDGDGHRVKKTAGTEATIFVYNASGQVVAEYSTTPPPSPQLNYSTADTIGSPRAITNASGLMTDRHDYMPFGEELIGLGNRNASLGYTSDNLSQRFTGKEQDFESGLEYFQSRYYSTGLGRFQSVDPESDGADLHFPQSWNAYSYTWNRPTILVDPDGRTVRICDTDGACEDISDQDAHDYTFNPAYARMSGFSISGNNILDENGAVVGSWERTSFDDLNDFANGVAFGRGNEPGMIGRAPALKKAILGFTAINLAPAITVVGLDLLAGGGITTLGDLTTYATKAAARQAITRMAASEAAKAAARSAVSRATTSSTIEIVEESGGLIVRISRAGRNGYQIVESVIKSDGAKSVVQKAFDAAGELVHYDPKF
jgi:RHS repeat-associated protein